jgi:hypothetical protein
MLAKYDITAVCRKVGLLKYQRQPLENINKIALLFITFNMSTHYRKGYIITGWRCKEGGEEKLNPFVLVS